MRFKVIDYCPDHFEVMPKERSGKFIQVMGNDTEYIIMSPRELSTFHANIAERFFSGMGLSGKYNHKRDNYTLNHPEWALPGGGHWEIDATLGTLTLSGQSLAYGRFISDGLAKKMQKAMPEYRVIIKS